MRSVLQSFQYLKGYYNRVILNVFITVIVSLLNIFSLFSVLPFLKIIFNTESTIKPVAKPEKLSLFPFDEFSIGLKQQYNYLIYSFSQEYSKVELLTYICIGVFLMFMLKNVFLYINRMIDKSIRYNVARDLRLKLYDKVLTLPIKNLSEQSRGDILTRFGNDILKVEENVLNGFSLIFKEPIMVIFYLMSMLIISVKLTLFILVLLPILGFVIGRISKSLKRKSSSFQTKFGELLSMLDETMFGAKVIKSFTAEEYLHKQFQQKNNQLKSIHRKIHLRKTSASPISEILGIGMVMIVLWYGGSLIVNQSERALTGELLILYLGLFSQMISPVKSLTSLYSNLQDGLASADRLESFLGVEDEYETISTEAIQPISFQDKIEFNNVSFSYPNTDTQVLNRLQLTIPKGTVTALVGQSGAGKSTIADLLPRFYTVTDGEILIDDKNINEIELRSLRSMISYVSQEAILFNDSVMKNIAFGLKDISREQIIEAATIANAHNFIVELEQGYDTNIGERGSKLSGGQRQRLTIARAILKNAPILILDEATSALDTESERLVQDAVNKLLKNRTAIVIAHRLSTIKNADQICVIQEGQVVEKGTHQSLLAVPNGHYKRLTDMQTL